LKIKITLLKACFDVIHFPTNFALLAKLKSQHTMLKYPSIGY
jgi:hypothetical protein